MNIIKTIGAIIICVVLLFAVSLMNGIASENAKIANNPDELFDINEFDNPELILEKIEQRIAYQKEHYDTFGDYPIEKNEEIARLLREKIEARYESEGNK